MAKLSEMLGIMESGGQALRQGIGAGMDRKRQAEIDEEENKERAARLELVDLQTKVAKRDLDLAMQGDAESGQMALSAKEMLQRDIEAFSKTVQTPEDEQILKQAKDNLRMANAISKWDPDKAGKFFVSPFDMKKQVEGQKQKAAMESEKFGLEKGKTQAEIEATRALTGQRLAETGKTKKETSLLGMPKSEDKKALFEMEQGLRKEFVAGTKSFGESQAAWEKLQKSAQANTAMGDHSAIFAYMKLIDPGSTVREGEFATVEQARGVPSTVLNLYNKALEGQRLTKEQREDITNRAKGFYDVHEKAYIQAKNEYSRIAKEQGVDPTRVTPELYKTGGGGGKDPLGLGTGKKDPLGLGL